MSEFPPILIETAQAIDDLDWVLEDDGEFESPEDYEKHWKYWVEMTPETLAVELRQHLIDAEVFAEEFEAFAAEYNASDCAASSEAEFLARVQFDLVYRWLHEQWLPDHEQ